MEVQIYPQNDLLELTWGNNPKYDPPHLIFPLH
jgi:hypothetical protein